MKREMVYCKAVKLKVNKEVRSPDYKCDTCPELNNNQKNYQQTKIVSHSKKPKKQKKVNRNKNQQEVFLDSEAMGAIVGRIDPKTNDLSLENYYEGVLEKTGKGRDRLNYLIACCFPDNDYITFKGIALSKFIEEAGRLSHEGILSRKEMELLLKTISAESSFKKLVSMDVDIEDQNITEVLEAIQKLIHIKPEVIRIPFVAEALIQILRAYKYRPKVTNSGLEKAWSNLLPNREWTGLPFSQRQIDILKKREPDNKKIADRLSVSERSIRRKSTRKGYPGRPKKK